MHHCDIVLSRPINLNSHRPSVVYYITKKMTQFFKYILKLNYQIVANTNLINTSIFKNVAIGNL